MVANGFNDGDMSLVGMIETESGRGEAYANDPVLGGYSVLPIRQEFSPKAYGAAIKAAEDAKFRTLILDSASHEWEGVSGVLSMAAEAQAEGKKGPLVWQRAKIEHAREFMLRLTQTSIPLVIVCMRAKFTMEEVVVNGKKEWQRSKFLSPKQSEDILYEMFIHGYIDQTHKFHGTKYTLDVLRKVFIDGEMITVETGQRLAAWAKGGAAAPAVSSHDAAHAQAVAVRDALMPKADAFGALGPVPQTVIEGNAKPPTFASISDLINRARKNKDSSLLVAASEQWQELAPEMRASLDVEARKVWREINPK